MFAERGEKPCVFHQPAKSLGVNSETNQVYATNFGSNKVTVIDGTQDRVVATIPTGNSLEGVGVNPSTNRIYVASFYNNKVSVIDGAQNKVISTIRVWNGPGGVGVNPKTNRIYVSGFFSDDVFVIDGAQGKVISTIPVRERPWGVGVNPITNKIYVANFHSHHVSVIDGALGAVIATIPVGITPFEVGVNATTNRIYVANGDSKNVSVLVGKDLLTNSSFDGDRDRDGLPDSWKPRNFDINDRLDSSGGNVYDGAFSMRLTGSAGVTKQLFQRIPVGGPAGTILNLEGFSKASQRTPGQGEYSVKVHVVYADGTSSRFDLNFGRSQRRLLAGGGEHKGSPFRRTMTTWSSESSMRTPQGRCGSTLCTCGRQSKGLGRLVLLDSPLEARIARLEGSYEQINERLDVIEQRLGRVEETINGTLRELEGAINGVRHDLEASAQTLRRELTQHMDRQFFWVLSLVIVSILVPIALRVLNV